jgi:hypothetical protein
MKKPGLVCGAVLLSTVAASASECKGNIEQKEVFNKNYKSYIIDDQCEFNGNTDYGKKILSACPVGTFCQIKADGQYSAWCILHKEGYISQTAF